jgi:hypothetical protein
MLGEYFQSLGINPNTDICYYYLCEVEKGRATATDDARRLLQQS